MGNGLATRLAKRYLPNWIRMPIRYARLRYTLKMRGFRDLVQRNRYPGVRIPSPLLRYRAEGSNISAHNYLNTGLNCAQNVRSALGRVGRRFDEFERVLDFGCGCGRVMRWFEKAEDSQILLGTDIDKRAVAWCRRHLPFAKFEVNKPYPPLSHEGDAFDLILNLSTVDHLDESHQEKWIGELKRVARPGGVLLASFYGRTAHQVLLKSDRETVKKEGFLFRIAATGFFKPDGLPDFYQIAFQSSENARALYSRHFKILEHIEGGFANFEDLLVCSK